MVRGPGGGSEIVYAVKYHGRCRTIRKHDKVLDEHFALLCN